MIVDIEDHACPRCRNGLHRIGEDVGERLDIGPAQLRAIVCAGLICYPAPPNFLWQWHVGYPDYVATKEARSRAMGLHACFRKGFVIRQRVK